MEIDIPLIFKVTLKSLYDFFNNSEISPVSPLNIDFIKKEKLALFNNIGPENSPFLRKYTPIDSKIVEKLINLLRMDSEIMLIRIEDIDKLKKRLDPISEMRDVIKSLIENLLVEFKVIGGNLSIKLKKVSPLALKKAYIDKLFEVISSVFDNEFSYFNIDKGVVKLNVKYQPILLNEHKMGRSIQTSYLVYHMLNVGLYYLASFIKLNRELQKESRSKPLSSRSNYDPVDQVYWYDASYIIHSAVGAFLHDVGFLCEGAEKLLSLTEIEGKLTDEQYNILKQHSEKSYELFNLHPILKNEELAKYVARNHHKSGGKIYSEQARISDIYDALTSKRPWRKQFPRSKAIEYIIKKSSQEFALENVKAFLQILKPYENGEIVNINRVSDNELLGRAIVLNSCENSNNIYSVISPNLQVVESYSLETKEGKVNLIEQISDGKIYIGETVETETAEIK